MLRNILIIYKYCAQILRQFAGDQCLVYASALAYTTLLALVPLMAVGLGLITAFPGFAEVHVKVQEFIINNFVATSADVIKQYLDSFSAQARNLSAPGLVGLVITAVMLVFSMETAFNHIWRVKKRRHGLSAFLMYWAVITLIPILLGVGFAISSYVENLSFFSAALQSNTLVLVIMPMLLTWFGLSLLYAALPNCRVLFRHALPAGFIAMIFFELAKYAFATFIMNFPTYQLLYGALATIPVFLIWLFVLWMVVLLGAVICHVFATGIDKVSN